MKREAIALIFCLTLSFPVAYSKTITKRNLPRFNKALLRVSEKSPLKKEVSEPARKVPEKKEQVQKKRILIFSSTGGGGHTAVSKGLKSYLGSDYDIIVSNVFQEVLGSLDTLGTLSFGRVWSEDFYNFCLRARWTNVAGKFVSVGGGFMAWRQDALESRLLEYFKFAKPDLIISVVPVINCALIVVSEKLDIPFLVLTNDLDSTNYINNVSKPQYKKFRYAIPFDDSLLHNKISKAGFEKEQVIVTGFPLRPEFFKPKDIAGLKSEFEIQEDKPVVMILMGGTGSTASYRYVRKLIKLNKPLHIIVCLGRNERLRRNINKIVLPPYITLTVLGFTDRIADLMAVSDVLITKTGPGSVCEALELNVPMILDQTSDTLWWEELNVTFMVKHGFAESLKNYNDLEKIFPKYIDDSSYVTKVKKKMKEFKRECFAKKIKPLIAEMIAMSQKNSKDGVEKVQASKKSEVAPADPVAAKPDVIAPVPQ